MHPVYWQHDSWKQNTSSYSSLQTSIPPSIKRARTYSRAFTATWLLVSRLPRKNTYKAAVCQKLPLISCLYNRLCLAVVSCKTQWVFMRSLPYLVPPKNVLPHQKIEFRAFVAISSLTFSAPKVSHSPALQICRDCHAKLPTRWAPLKKEMICGILLQLVHITSICNLWKHFALIWWSMTSIWTVHDAL